MKFFFFKKKKSDSFYLCWAPLKESTKIILIIMILIEFDLIKISHDFFFFHLYLSVMSLNLYT